MRAIWFDISAGVSGDMMLGSLVDAGIAVGEIQAALDQLIPGAVVLRAEQVLRAGQRATKISVEVLDADPPHRTWRDIRSMLAHSGLHERTRQRALDVFDRLARAEGRVHGMPPEDVHFHEVGALDSIADVVGVCEAIRLAQIEVVTAGPVALGSGRVRVAHGDIAVPVPAVAELVTGWPIAQVYDAAAAHDEGNAHGHADHHHDHSHAGHDHAHHDRPAPVLTPGQPGELATPTGMALIRSLADGPSPTPVMTPSSVGVGAGGRDVVGRPNVVRAFLGETAQGCSYGRDTVVELMANVDDMDPRLWPGVLERLLERGALDAWLVPITMKKGRPAFTLHALVRQEQRAAAIEEILAGTSTLGVREMACARSVLDRSLHGVEVLGQPVRVKVASHQGRVVHAAAEFESIAEIALLTGTRQADVAARAAAAIAHAGILPGAGVDGGTSIS